MGFNLVCADGNWFATMRGLFNGVAKNGSCKIWSKGRSSTTFLADLDGCVLLYWETLWSLSAYPAGVKDWNSGKNFVSILLLLCPLPIPLLWNDCSKSLNAFCRSCIQLSNESLPTDELRSTSDADVTVKSFRYMIRVIIDSINLKQISQQSDRISADLCKH